jgi:hypothetical protein
VQFSAWHIWGIANADLQEMKDKQMGGKGLDLKHFMWIGVSKGKGL